MSAPVGQQLEGDAPAAEFGGGEGDHVRELALVGGDVDARLDVGGEGFKHVAGQVEDEQARARAGAGAGPKGGEAGERGGDRGQSIQCRRQV